MGRDHNPVPGQWYESLEDEETFQVLSVDEDSELIELQYEDGDVEEIDYETWQELDLELTEQPEGWSGSDDKESDEDFDDDDDDDDDDDWDDDDDEEDEEDDEEDYGDRDDY
jgi:segregation and condensation protein B